MGRMLSITVCLLLLACGEARPGEKALSRDRVGAAASPSAMAISSSAFTSGGPIDARYSAYGANHSPPLNWTPVAGARSYALILEDPDAAAAKPWGHWLIWNIAGDAAGLPEGVAQGANPPVPAGVAQGRGDADAVGYFGPRPPNGIHHYHFQVFALDRRLDIPAGSTRDALLAAMRGHVLASGELVGVYSAPVR